MRTDAIARVPAAGTGAFDHADTRHLKAVLVVATLVGMSWVVAVAGRAPQEGAAARVDLVRSGKVRVGINFGNPLLASRNPKGGGPGGIAVDLAHELGRRLGVPVELIGYDSAGEMAEGATTGAWDAAFLAIDPARATDIVFTAPYLEIDATYLVPAQSPLGSVADVDRTGLQIAVSDRSAYDLALTRTLQHATLRRAPSVEDSLSMFLESRLAALAGLRPWLVTVAEALPGARVLDGRFTVVEQAVGMPQGRTAGARFLHDFVEDVKASGIVADLVIRNGVRGVSVAPKQSKSKE